MGMSTKDLFLEALRRILLLCTTGDVVLNSFVEVSSAYLTSRVVCKGCVAAAIGVSFLYTRYGATDLLVFR